MIPGDFQIKKPSGKQMILFTGLGLGGLVSAVVVVVGVTWMISAWFGTPIILSSDEGPDQPIAFPHTTHVQELGLDCTFCHREVTTSAQASIPSVNLCMTCHQVVLGSTEGAEAEIKKLRDTFDDGDAIAWVRVHRVPDHVHFVHEAHIRVLSARDGIAETAVCSTCHGDVGSMEKVRQVRDLKMSDCVDCHRDNAAPTDCTTCHY